MMKKVIQRLKRWLTTPETPVRGAPRLTTIGIFCGNCANRWKHGGHLTRTFLTTAGQCNGCGGRSYILASLYSPLVASRIKSERAPTTYSDQPIVNPLKGRYHYDVHIRSLESGEFSMSGQPVSPSTDFANEED